MTGYSLTQIFKYFLVLLIGWEMTGTRNLNIIIFYGLLYMIICFILGYVWYYFELVNAEAEIVNQYNPLAKQLRGKFRMAKDIKTIKS